MMKGGDGIPVAEPRDLSRACGSPSAWRPTGRATGTIAVALNERATAPAAAGAANPFTKDTVCAMLQNRFYLGELPGRRRARPGAARGGDRPRTSSRRRRRSASGGRVGGRQVRAPRRHRVQPVGAGGLRPLRRAAAHPAEQGQAAAVLRQPAADRRLRYRSTLPGHLRGAGRRLPGHVHHPRRLPRAAASSSCWRRRSGRTSRPRCSATA